MTLTKVCGARSAKDATMIAEAGADFVGIVAVKGRHRFVDATTARTIAQAARAAGAEPVAIFNEATAEQIVTYSREAQIDWVELQGDRAKATCGRLPAYLKVFYALTPTDCDPPPARVAFVLFDSPGGGTGQRLLLDTIPQVQGHRRFIAGGLTPDTVAEVITTLRPEGVSVATGVENQAGRPDPKKVRAFIRAARQASKGRHGPYGGRYVSELLIAPLEELENAYERLRADAQFVRELHALFTTYAGRPTPLTEAATFASAARGPRLFLKREDLLHTGAHKLNNALGQCLLAQALGKSRVIAETGAGQHGVATATACARLGLECTVFMGATDIERQKPNVHRMKLLGAEVIPVHEGSGTLKEAINEAMRHWSAHYETTLYCLGSVCGPHPYPAIVHFFQSVIGQEARLQIVQVCGRLPNAVIACVGGGSNAIGIFDGFLNDDAVELFGIEAGGEGIATGRHAARFCGGSPGVLHGAYSYLLQDEHGQIQATHSVSAGLDYPSIGPEHAKLHDTGRAQYHWATDAEALEAFALLSRLEGILPALESSHALAGYRKLAPQFASDDVVIVNLSGRGDKDLDTVMRRLA